LDQREVASVQITHRRHQADTPRAGPCLPVAYQLRDRRHNPHRPARSQRISAFVPPAASRLYHAPHGGLETGVEPGHLRDDALHMVDVVYRALVVPAAAVPPAEAAPEVAAMIGGIAGQGRPVGEIGGPAFVAGADYAIDILRVKRGVIAAHRPGTLEVVPLNLKDAVALIAAGAGPGAVWAEAL